MQVVLAVAVVAVIAAVVAPLILQWIEKARIAAAIEDVLAVRTAFQSALVREGDVWVKDATVSTQGYSQDLEPLYIAGLSRRGFFLAALFDIGYLSTDDVLRNKLVVFDPEVWVWLADENPYRRVFVRLRASANVSPLDYVWKADPRNRYVYYRCLPEPDHPFIRFLDALDERLDNGDGPENGSVRWGEHVINGFRCVSGDAYIWLVF
ncbi:hypothetical protein [Thermosulfurimonas sp. F29]|uniref:hypothetical protein n=1 Tax=Thermosulfurimonas sp. F29 TaxID=2867247 RepID=UPI001C83DE48|nr:hypothetical protein [Thermosulfurimonas sp. F29]MBX6423789.1 hypothetical protein [Thermosulfurimonas sp. F29]